MSAFDLRALLACLHEHDVRFVVIGGVAVGAHGYVRGTEDLDLVPDPDPQNLARLVEAMAHLESTLPTVAGRPFDVATDAASAGVLAGSAASDEGGSGPHPGPSGSGEPSERVRLGASAGDHWLKGLAGHVNLAMRHPDLDGASIQSQALPQRRLASASGTEASEPVLAPAGAKSSGPVSGRGKPPEPG